MTLSVDVFWSFRSPYSYLATPQLTGIAREYDVEFAVRPVYPLAIRDDQFFEKRNPLFISYLLRDIQRIGEMKGIPIGFPSPDPIVQNMETREIAPDQPYIHRLTRLGVEAALHGRGLPFITEVSKIIWDGTVHGWDQGDHLKDAAARAGLDLASMDEAVAADPDNYDARIEANQNDLQKAGHWGVPTMVFEGEPFFGQDRIDALLWRLNQRGLERRAT